MDSFIKLAELWERKTSSGITYYEGWLHGTTWLTLIPNIEKRYRDEPDYILKIREHKTSKKKLKLTLIKG